MSAVNLLLPALLTGVALFFASFLSWMVVQLHKTDWLKMPGEEAVMDALRQASVPPGNYMFPGCTEPKEMGTPEFQERYKRGPNGVLTVFSGGGSMGRNLSLTMAFFIVASFCIGYLASLGIPAGADFMVVFRFVSTAAFLTYFSAIALHAIWFRCRIVGHLIESIAFAAISGAIFGALWPNA